MILIQKENHMLLEEGDVIELTEGLRVYANIPEHFVYSNRKGSFALTRHDVALGGEFEYLCGKYIVYKTTFDGGGTGHGSNDIYPDGHHVFCLKSDDENIKVDFYQSGCFTATIKDIEPVGKAVLKWSDK
jgi:hypothetical protein